MKWLVDEKKTAFLSKASARQVAANIIEEEQQSRSFNTPNHTVLQDHKKELTSLPPLQPDPQHLHLNEGFSKHLSIY